MALQLRRSCMACVYAGSADSHTSRFPPSLSKVLSATSEAGCVLRCSGHGSQHRVRSACVIVFNGQTRIQSLRHAWPCHACLAALAMLPRECLSPLAGPRVPICPVVRSHLMRICSSRGYHRASVQVGGHQHPCIRQARALGSRVGRPDAHAAPLHLHAARHRASPSAGVRPRAWSSRRAR